MKLPERSLNKEDIFATLDAYRARDLDAKGGKVWSYAYHLSPEVDRIAADAYVQFLGVNGLDPTAFPSLLKLENEVVSMLAAHLGGGRDAAGSFTSGGTESIILATKAARDHARATRPQVTRPEMILPITAHAAFHKAAHYLGLKVVLAPVDCETLRADTGAMRELITDQTVLLVGSTPSYAHGVLDPIEELGALALEKGLWLHVDACIGGFLLPYFRRLGEDVPPFDLSVPGVSSLSVDLHKYACCAKGASVVLYQNKELRKHQIFSCSQWTGYSVVNPTIQSTKSGGPLAAAWAVLHAIGDEGYLEMARALRDATRAIARGIEATPSLRLVGEPALSLLAFTSDEVSVFHVADEMKQRGWHVQPQLAFEGAPPTIHLTVAPQNVPQVEAVIADLRQSVEAARTLGPGQLKQILAGALGGLDSEGLDEGAFSSMLAMAGVSSDALPERMADINEVLELLPAPLSERLLTAFVNDMFCAQA